MRRIRLFLVASIIIVIGVMAKPTFSAQEDRIAFIDLQRVIHDSKAGKKAKASFQKEFEKKRTIIEQKMAQLEKLKQEFVKNSALMNPEARKKKADLIEKKEKELQRTREDFREELREKDLELTQKILKEIDGILQQIGEKDGYALIFERTEAGIVYGSPAVDITEKVIKEYDKKYK